MSHTYELTHALLHKLCGTSVGTDRSPPIVPAPTYSLHAAYISSTCSSAGAIYQAIYFTAAGTDSPCSLRYITVLYLIKICSIMQTEPTVCACWLIRRLTSSLWLWLDGVAHTLYDILQTWNWSHVRLASGTEQVYLREPSPLVKAYICCDA